MTFIKSHYYINGKERFRFVVSNASAFKIKNSACCAHIVILYITNITQIISLLAGYCVVCNRGF